MVVADHQKPPNLFLLPSNTLICLALYLVELNPKQEIENKKQRVDVDDRRTLQPLEIPLLIKIHRKRGMGWLIALDEPIFNKPAKTKERPGSEPYYDYVI